MSNNWEAKINVWGFFGTPKERLGDSPKTFKFEANNINDALKRAELICVGIRTNPDVWQANVISLKEI
jgi:hypothetical protein